MTATIANHAANTLTAHRQIRWTPGWITTNTITMPRVGTPAAMSDQSDKSDPSDLSADQITLPDLSRLASYFLAAADRMADLARAITRLEIAAKSGTISPSVAARRLRRIMAAIQSATDSLTAAH
jgi:hypothetical protein